MAMKMKQTKKNGSLNPKPRIGQRPPGLRPQVIPNKKKNPKVKHKKDITE